MPIVERSEVHNLLLLCSKHHDLIDKDDPDRYPVEVLQYFKRQHEERIFHLTSMAADQKTTVIWFRAIVSGELVNSKLSDLYEALWRRGRYPRDAQGILIDLTQHPDGKSEAFYQLAKEQIDAKIAALYTRDLANTDVCHVSVFAIGPIPLLVYLGHKLSNKVPTELFQRHRDTEDWSWKDEASQALHHLELRRPGTDLTQVALVLSLSGLIDLNDLPSSIDERFFVYGITLGNMLPNPAYLRTPGDLDNFKAIYHECLAVIRGTHPQAKTIHLFPAIPAPVAVLCGRELLKKVYPSLIVYDNQKDAGGFIPIMEVG